MRKALTILSALTLLAGCSASRSQYTPAQMPASRKAQTEQYVYVTQYYSNSLTKYSLDGQMLWSTTTGLASPEGVAVDAGGKIYVANGNDTVTTYDQYGNQTTPTIAKGLHLPFGIAVDAAGKIYVTNLGKNDLTTYNADGTETEPTIKGFDGIGGVAVGTGGKIYVVNSSTNAVTAYTPTGKPTKPTITVGLNQPIDVKVGGGKIWVSNYKKPSAITSYTSGGKQVDPTITQGLNGLYCIALSSTRIYAANRRGREVTVYTKQGKQTSGTIGGLTGSLTGVAIY